jgi:NADH-quinone oxidoreductase subunit J
MSIEQVLFFLLSAMAIASGFMVVTRKSPITAAMFLVMHFMSLGGLYLTLHAQFMAVIQVLVYAGAIMVLVMFVIMLLNLGKEEALSERITSRESVGVALSMMLGGVLIWAITRVVHPRNSPGSQNALANGTIEAVGKSLFTTYVFPFEMVSLVLLAAAVGAVVLTKRHLR